MTITFDSDLQQIWTIISSKKSCRSIIAWSELCCTTVTCQSTKTTRS